MTYLKVCPMLWKSGIREDSADERQGTSEEPKANLMTLTEQLSQVIHGNKLGLLVWEGQEQGAFWQCIWGRQVEDFNVSHFEMSFFFCIQWKRGLFFTSSLYMYISLYIALRMSCNDLQKNILKINIILLGHYRGWTEVIRGGVGKGERENSKAKKEQGERER